MYSILGSMLLNEPDKKYIDKSFLYSEWNIPFDVGDTEKIYVVKKRYLKNHDKILIWIKVFKPAFPENVIEDAKRIAFDIKPIGFLRHMNPSFHAILCLYLSSYFHHFDFMEKKKEIMELKNEGMDVFGVKRKRTMYGEKMLTMLRKYSKIAIDMMPDKFENLQKMYDKMEGLDGKEVDNIHRNQPATGERGLQRTRDRVQEGIHISGDTHRV